MRKHIICPLRDGKLTSTDHTFDFRKWIGRPLSKHERRLINTLERIRRKRKIRVHITDRPGVNSTSILISYIQYLQTLYPRQPCAVYAGTKKEAQIIAKKLPGETFPCSVKRPFSIRGCNYDMALVLNPPQKYIDNILRTIIPAVYDRAGCAIIILTASPLVLNRRAMKRKQLALPPAYYEQFDDPNPPPDLPTEHTVIVDLSDHTIIPLADDDGDQNEESFALLY